MGEENFIKNLDLAFGKINNTKFGKSYFTDDEGNKIEVDGMVKTLLDTLREQEVNTGKERTKLGLTGDGAWTEFVALTIGKWIYENQTIDTIQNTLLDDWIQISDAGWTQTNTLQNIKEKGISGRRGAYGEWFERDIFGLMRIEGAAYNPIASSADADDIFKFIKEVSLKLPADFKSSPYFSGNTRLVSEDTDKQMKAFLKRGNPSELAGVKGVNSPPDKLTVGSQSMSNIPPNIKDHELDLLKNIFVIYKMVIKMSNFIYAELGENVEDGELYVRFMAIILFTGLKVIELLEEITKKNRGILAVESMIKKDNNDDSLCKIDFKLKIQMKKDNSGKYKLENFYRIVKDILNSVINYEASRKAFFNESGPYYNMALRELSNEFPASIGEMTSKPRHTKQGFIPHDYSKYPKTGYPN